MKFFQESLQRYYDKVRELKMKRIEDEEQKLKEQQEKKFKAAEDLGESKADIEESLA